MIPAIIRQASAFILTRSQPKYHRFIHNQIDFSELLIGIRGARGSGKTTVLLQYAANGSYPKDKILYAACDHPAMIGIDLYQLAQTFYQEGGKLLLIDEIHKNSGFGPALKAIRDTFDLQVIFSGSSAIRIDRETTDLSRRASLYQLPVLSLREFIEIETESIFPAYSLAEIAAQHGAVSAEVCSRIRPIEYFKKYLQYGAYPFYRESLQSYAQKLVEVVNITIDSDLCSIYNIDPSKLDKLKKILYMLSTTSPLELNKSKLSAAVGTSWVTLANYLERMQAGSLLHQIRAGSGMRTVNKADKLLLNNANLCYALCATPNIGSIRETFFVSQLTSGGHQVHYHDQGDFIVDDSLIFEIGGSSKTTAQLGQQEKSYVAADDIETGAPRQIPLWCFGMLY